MTQLKFYFKKLPAFLLNFVLAYFLLILLAGLSYFQYEGILFWLASIIVFILKPGIWRIKYSVFLLGGILLVTLLSIAKDSLIKSRFAQVCNYDPGHWLILTTPMQKCTCLGIVIKNYSEFTFDAPKEDYCLGKVLNIQKINFIIK